jgi:uncharacterized glyoxalase superfamily protein PhnB
MAVTVKYAVPVLPAGDVAASLKWWTETCGFTETFRSGEPPSYAGLHNGAVLVHIANVDGAELARAVGEQTMVRFAVDDIHAFYAAYQERGGVVHPNGSLHAQPWGGLAFSAIDPGGVCVTFTGE